MRRFLITSGVVLAICGAGLAIFSYAFLRLLTSADPYPTFLTDYQSSAPRSYEEAVRSFSEFVVRAFPAGSDAKDAIAQITSGGFEVRASNPDSVELLWKRHAGPCSEWYWIVVDKKADGTIAKTTGRLHPFCL
jgi:hypothetical protein